LSNLLILVIIHVDSLLVDMILSFLLASSGHSYHTKRLFSCSNPIFLHNRNAAL
jgi:hypothetical protein